MKDIGWFAGTLVLLPDREQSRFKYLVIWDLGELDNTCVLLLGLERAFSRT